MRSRVECAGKDFICSHVKGNACLTRETVFVVAIFFSFFGEPEVCIVCTSPSQSKINLVLSTHHSHIINNCWRVIFFFIETTIAKYDELYCVLAENCLFPAGSESLFDLDSTYTIEMDAKTDYFARRSNDVRGYDFAMGKGSLM